MSKDYTIELNGHNSIYMKDYENGNYSDRKYNVYFSTPESEVNEETGILLLIAGYGANANSNVYKKMRESFADKYNLVTIQCDYFGWEFMQSSMDTKGLALESIDINRIKDSLTEEEFNKVIYDGKLDLLQLLQANFTQENTIYLRKDQDETIENFNDMGIMQALDNISAVINVLAILYNNNFNINTKKIIIMGQSQGAYLSYLCNRLCPNLFTYILDNSSWIFPSYLDELRVVPHYRNNLFISVIYDYFAKKNNIRFKFLDLREMYSNFNNRCKIVIYHGEDDQLISVLDKYEAVKNIDCTVFNKITSEVVDGKVFTTTTHGLGADFLNLFDAFYKQYVEKENIKGQGLAYDNLVQFDELSIDYSSGLPVVLMS